jgi:mono/diheme cytochrome c family protein
MKPTLYPWRRIVAACGLCTMLLAATAGLTIGASELRAGSLFAGLFGKHSDCHDCGHGCVSGVCPPANGGEELGGTWFWLHSPDEEKRITMALFNRYCIRCHGIDGRGVWDIPGIPNFADPVWQGSRSDAQIVRMIIEGRGAVMPQFRGTLSLEEAWAMARYLRTFVPGAEASRPETLPPGKPAAPSR